MEERKYESNENYSSDDMIDDLEQIRALLHGAKRKINRSKLEKSDITFEIKVEIE